MGEEEARAEVVDVVANGTKSAEKVEKDVINNEDQTGVKVTVEENNNEKEVDAGEEVGAEKMDEDKAETEKENRSKEKEEKMDEDKEEVEKENGLKEKEEEKQDAKNEAIEEEKGLGEVKQEEDKKDEKVDMSEVKMNDVEEGKGKMDDEEISKKKMVDDEVSKEKTVDEEVNEEKMDYEEESKEKMDDEEEGEEEIDTMKEKQEEKGSKKRKRGKSALEKSEDQAEVKEEDPKTPTISNRPVRQRKSVERLVAVIEKDMFREFHVEKGCGTRLKDIPNVAYKLTRRKAEDTVRLLHTIIFGRRGKAGDIKNNISRFSGFVWRDNEEKQKLKVKEKLDRCVKEKLLEICDVLDIPIAKSTSKKDDIVAKLIDFLVAPHATTTVLLAEKEQSSKGKKRVRDGSASRSLSTSRRRPAKSRKRSSGSKREVDKSTSDTEGVSDEEKKEETNNGVPEKSEDENSEHSESKEKNDASEESEEDTAKARKGSKRNSSKDSAGKGKTKEVTTPKKPTLREKGTPKRSSSNPSRVSDDVDTSPKVFSRKKKNDQGDEEQAPVSKRSASKEKSGKRTVKGKEKLKDVKKKPTDDELRNAVSEILKQVDFTTATFKDILKQLSKRFSADLTSRKAAIKLMLQDELTKLADEAEDDEGEGDEDAEKEEAKPAEQGIAA